MRKLVVAMALAVLVAVPVMAQNAGPYDLFFAGFSYSNAISGYDHEIGQHESVDYWFAIRLAQSKDKSTSLYGMGQGRYTQGTGKSNYGADLMVAEKIENAPLHAFVGLSGGFLTDLALTFSQTTDKGETPQVVIEENVGAHGKVMLGGFLTRHIILAVAYAPLYRGEGRVTHQFQIGTGYWFGQ